MSPFFAYSFKIMAISYKASNNKFKTVNLGLVKPGLEPSVVGPFSGVYMVLGPLRFGMVI